MNCPVCGKEMMNTVGGNYHCSCGYSVNDLVDRSKLGFIRTGWQCPKCGAILSPDMSWCPFCSGNNGGYIVTCGSGDVPKVDWSKSICGVDLATDPHIVKTADEGIRINQE